MRSATRLTRCSLLIAHCFLIVPSVWALGQSEVGTSGAEFLKIGPGARPAAMGEAFTGLADDIHSIYWNPAGLGTLKSPELTGMHMQYFQSIQYEFGAFAYPTSLGTWAFAITNLHTDDIERRTEDTDTNIGTFGSNDSAYYAGYGKQITSRLSLGANFKWIRQTLDTTHSNAYAGDGGILYDTPWHDVRLGASMQNLGSKVKFANEADPLPLTYRLGASAPILARHMLVSSDLIIPRDHQVGLAMGTEYKGHIANDLGYALRAGYRTDSDVDGFSGLSLGSGLDVGRASFDFAWVPFGELGNSYRFGLHLKFGPTPDSLQPPTNLQPQQASAKSGVKPDPADSGRDSVLEQLLSL